MAGAEPSPRPHWCLYPYSAAGLTGRWSKITGMEALLAREIRMRQASGSLERLVPVTLTAAGTEDGSRVEMPEARVTVEPAEPDPDPAATAARLAVWFDEIWSLMHPAAFTTPGLTEELATVVYPPLPGVRPGSFERVAEHVARRRRERTADPDAAFADRFEPALAAIAPGATVGWTEVFFSEAILRHADRLRASGAEQSLHCFLAHPESLHRTPTGRRLLEAMSRMDRVHLQTDAYVRRLGRQLEELQLPVPELVRFDLAPDVEALLTAVAEEPPEGARLDGLDPAQRALVADAVATRGRIPQRFLCPDRLDPIKGIHVVLEAVDRFLESQELPLEELRRRFRFYFVTDYYSRFPEVDRSLAWHRYAEWVRTHQIPRFRERWSGIVWFADNVPDRFVWAHLLVDAHLISGGIQEGLGLAVQEGLVVNAALGRGRTVVMGSGAGFALQTAEEGCDALVWFPKMGDARRFAESLAEVVALPAVRHLERTRELVERFVEPHRDRLLPG